MNSFPATSFVCIIKRFFYSGDELAGEIQRFYNPLQMIEAKLDIKSVTGWYDVRVHRMRDVLVLK